MLKDCFISRWVDNARIHRVGFSKRVAGLGSTATEMGLIGAVVLVASLGFLFFLGEALQYAFSFVRKDMVTQVATANGLSPEAFVAQWKGGQPGQNEGILNPVQPTAPVVTAGSNGNEAHAEIYKALQELIDRSLQKGTMTQAQADLLKAYVDQYIYVSQIWELIYDELIQVEFDTDRVLLIEVQFEGQTYLLTELAARLGVEWDSWFSRFIISDEIFDSSEEGVLSDLFMEIEENKLLDNPDVIDFLDKFYANAFGDF